MAELGPWDDLGSTHEMGCVHGSQVSQDSADGVRPRELVYRPFHKPRSLGRASEKALALITFTPRQRAREALGFEEGRCGVRLGKGFLLQLMWCKPLPPMGMWV